VQALIPQREEENKLRFSLLDGKRRMNYPVASSGVSK